ncbi:MAG: hypothetical protein V1839_00320 [archaeon]
MDILKIESAIAWILLIAGIVFTLWYIFGQSPTLEQSLLVFVLGILFKMQMSIGKLQGKLNEHMRSHK